MVRKTSSFLFPPGAKTFGLTRFTVTPKDFAPTRFQRDESAVAILRNAPGDLSEPQRRFHLDDRGAPERINR
jgi:hypothetical protein